jgi:diguanylate cyclase (GGDEF)-like protein
MLTRGVKLAVALRFADCLDHPRAPTTALVKRGIALGERLLVNDRLTNLYNESFFYWCVQRESKRASRTGRPLSLVFMDLDDFKFVTDAHGDVLSRRALVEAAAVIRENAYETNVVAHLDGGEFAIVLPDSGGETALAVGERLHQRIAAHPFLADQGLKIRLTASVGVASLPDAAASAEELVEAADNATCAARASGGNGVRVAVPKGQP